MNLIAIVCIVVFVVTVACFVGYSVLVVASRCSRMEERDGDEWEEVR